MTNKEIKLAIDAMGGDDAPQCVISGTALAMQNDPDLRPILVGDENQLKPLMQNNPILHQAEILHTEDMVTSDEVPSQALRTGKNSSMRLAIDLVKSGEASAVVSAGNSGALMIMALMVLRTIEGIERPALAALFPTLNGPSCMLDLGANIDCSSTNLVQFAAMGDAFYRVIGKVDRPSIGLLNVGEEEQKGSASIREAAAILSDPAIQMNYAGFIEGDGIPMGEAQVIVCDGFSGNVALKTAEGTSKLIGTMIRNSFRATIFSRLGYILARRSFQQLRDMMNPQRYNGAVLLGLNGIVVKSHGGANQDGIANAIKVASDMHRHGFMDDLKNGIARSIDAIEVAQSEKMKSKEETS